MDLGIITIIIIIIVVIIIFYYLWMDNYIIGGRQIVKNFKHVLKIVKKIERGKRLQRKVCQADMKNNFLQG